MIHQHWASKPALPRCPDEGQVHVWRVSLSDEGADPLLWRRFLSEEERLRADRFHFEKDRSTYTTTRGVLRSLLGHYLTVTPQSIRFFYSPFGKPSLDPPQNSRQITFNVSHSGDYALLAFGNSADLGVDIEHKKHNDVEEIAQTVLSPSEWRVWERLPPEEREPAFLRAWTHKEAVVKAVGCGLSVALTSIEIAFHLSESVLLSGGFSEIEPAFDWSLYELSVHPDYAAALAVRACAIEVQLWDWKEGKTR